MVCYLLVIFCYGVVDHRMMELIVMVWSLAVTVQLNICFGFHAKRSASFLLDMLSPAASCVSF
jgi:hypothetical protein